MKGVRRFVVRPRAGTQITAAIHYDAITMHAPNAARGLLDKLQRAYELIKQHPGAGSPGLDAELGRPGLRSRKLPRVPLPDRLFPPPRCRDVVDVPHKRTDYVTALIARLPSS